jgi:cytochrome c oxidase subunit III
LSTSTAEGHGEIEHIHTTLPFWVGVGAFLMLLGFAYMPLHGFAVTIPGILLFVVASLGWAAHDIRSFESKPKQWQGQHIGWWGMMFFLATELMTFGALFSAYFAKRAQVGLEQWVPADVTLPVGVALINTALLISSGLVLHWGEVQLKKENRRNFILGLAGSIFLGLVFLGVQAYEYYEFIVVYGVGLTHSIWANNFFLLTGMHGFHVIVGLFILGTMLVRALAGNFDAKRHVAVTASALYWHFVDIVWIFLVIVVYLRWI